MAKLIAIASVLASLGCGAGSNDVAPLRREASPAALVIVPCTNTPQDCGVRICLDCTADAPPGTEAACVRSICTFHCAAGFVKIAGGCLSQSFSSSY